MPTVTASTAATFTSESLSDLGFDTESTIHHSNGFQIKGFTFSPPRQPFTMVVDLTDSSVGCAAKVVWTYDTEEPRTFECAGQDSVDAMRGVIDRHL